MLKEFFISRKRTKGTKRSLKEIECDRRKSS